MLSKLALLTAVFMLAQPGAPMAKQRVTKRKATYGQGVAAMLNSAELATRYIPAPPSLNIVYGTPPAELVPPGTVAANFYDPNARTMYLQGADKFARGHETGHAFDDQVLTDQDRARLTAILGLSGPWDRPDYSSSPNEWFADYYAAAATGMNLRREQVSSYAQLTPRRLKRFKRALRRIGQAHPELGPYQ